MSITETVFFLFYTHNAECVQKIFDIFPNDVRFRGCDVFATPHLDFPCKL